MYCTFLYGERESEREERALLTPISHCTRFVAIATTAHAKRVVVKQVHICI